NATIFAQPAESDRAMLMLAGNATVDLEDLTRTSPARHIDVWLLGGNVTVRLADDHTARTKINVLAGNIHDMRLAESERRQGGIFLSRSFDQSVASGQQQATTVPARLAGGNVYLEDWT